MPNMLKFKEFTLDKFQVEAIEAIENDHSVVVSAQTGTGKTLIADYIIDKYMKSGMRVIYTAPIKALSNQKYRDFKEDYGAENVGILTGDVVVNPEAPILVMTTEIYRNMLLSNDKSVQQIKYVVFDEIHYITDIERGVVWEESIIFSPKSVRFLCLSATIPNAIEFADWIEKVHENKVEVVTNTERAVPLQHWVYDIKLGKTNVKELKKDMELDKYPRYDKFMGNRGRKQKKWQTPAPFHIDLVRDMQAEELFPAIYFVFSRKSTEQKAVELAKKINLAKKEDIPKIVDIFNKFVNKEIRHLDSTQRLKMCVQKGVAFHHAGLLPKLKEAVEHLFGEGLIKVLYATETFSVGINMPAKAVCFQALEKYDGISFRYLQSREYFQCAGRAGRRGIDKIGHSISMVDRSKDDIRKIMKITTAISEPLISQYKLTVNTVLNLVERYNDEEIDFILKKSFDYYLRKKQQKDIRIMASFKNRVGKLTKMGYISKDRKLTEKGDFAKLIYSNEILMGEIFGTDLYNGLSDIEILIVIATIIYEGRRGNKFSRHDVKQQVRKITNKLDRNNYVAKNLNITNMKCILPMVTAWANGCSFDELMEYSNLLEGDYIRLFRQVIDFLRQIRRATTDHDLIDKVEDGIRRIDRDVVAVEF